MCVDHHARHASFWNRFDTTGDHPMCEGTPYAAKLHSKESVQRLVLTLVVTRAVA